MDAKGRVTARKSSSMDNLTHSLTGWALGQTGLKTKSRKGLAALILAANMPDIDVLFGWVPWTPLATHRGFTHGLLGGVIVMPAMLAGLLWLLDWWQRKRGTTFPSRLPMHVPWLIGLCYLGALTHPLLDLQTTYSVQLLSPISPRWYHTDTLFIIDATTLAILAMSVWLSRRRERFGLPWRRPAMIGLAAVGSYIALNGAITVAARQALSAHLGHSPEIAFASPEPLLFWKRSLVWRERGSIGQAHYDPLLSLSALRDVGPVRKDNMHDPLTLRAIELTPSLQSFLRWSTIPVAIIQKRRCEASVEFGDARFFTPSHGEGSNLRSARPFRQQPITVSDPAQDCPPAARRQSLAK